MPQETTSTTTSPKKPKPLQCNLCQENTAWKGPLCQKCRLFKQKHYAEGTGDTENVAYFCVAEWPDLRGPSGNVTSHQTWAYDAEKMIKDAFLDAKSRIKNYAKVRGRYTFAIHCDVNTNTDSQADKKPTKKTMDYCYPLLKKELLTYARKDKPIMVFAAGPLALKALGFKFRKYANVQGKFLETTIDGRRVVAFPSMSKRQLLTKSGFVEVMQRHVDQFLSTVYGLDKNIPVQTEVPFETLIKQYVFPKTLKEVRELVEMVVDFSFDGAPAHKHPIALDTETNTVNPHREKLKLLNLVVAWAPGKAAAIPVEHPESPWTLDEVYPCIAPLLKCRKPKVFHNGQFDIKVLKQKGWSVNNYGWDTMLVEHLLAEDKRGFYSLKAMTKMMLPQYAGYEDQLQEIKARIDKEVPKDDKEETEKTKPKEALKGAEKKLAEDDGYISIPLKVLNEYAAIDADVTRQLFDQQWVRIRDENNTLNYARKTLRRNRHEDFQNAAKPGIGVPNPTTNLLWNLVIPATKALANMELRGMRVDREYAEELNTAMTKSIMILRNELYLMTPQGLFEGEDFNPNSSPHLRRVLFGSGYHHPDDSRRVITYTHLLDSDSIAKTPTGQISTNKNFLRYLVQQHECAFSKVLLKYRALVKAQSTFINNIQALSKEDGRMHTSFHVVGTATGRLSSSNENMQNIPKFIGEHNIKKIFIPTDPENQIIVNADAKAAEVRVYAAYSRDKNLIQALNEGLDPHSFFASKVYDPSVVLSGVPQSEQKNTLSLIGIDENHAWNYSDFQNRYTFKKTDGPYYRQLDKLRTNIKRVVFGILYGAGKRKIAETAGIPLEQAQAIIDVLFRMFPTIPRYMRTTKDQIHLLGVVETFLGRRRRFMIKNMTQYLKAKAERQSVNFKIQSTSSDIVLGVLTDIDGPLRDLESRLLITVHDSVVFETPKKYAGQLSDFMEEYGVRRVAEKYPWLPVPFKWDVEVGPSYGELQDVDDYLKDHPRIIEEGDDYIDMDIRQDLANLGG